MSNAKISDNQWEKIFNFLKLQKGIYVGAEDSCRQFILAVFWMQNILGSKMTIIRDSKIGIADFTFLNIKKERNHSPLRLTPKLIKNTLNKNRLAAFTTRQNHRRFRHSMRYHKKPFINLFDEIPTNKSGLPIFSVNGYCIWFVPH
jgi:hypothetical protein